MKSLFVSLCLACGPAMGMKIIIQYEGETKKTADLIRQRLLDAYYLPESRVETMNVRNCEIKDRHAIEWCLKKNGDLSELPKKQNSLIKTSLLVFRRIRND